MTMNASARIVHALLLFLAGWGVAAQPEVSLTGAVDFHCHTGPDTAPRSINSFQAVRQAKEAGMRALVLKNHFLPTAQVAQLAQDEVGGIEVFGGIALNRSNGGINAEAIRRMAQVEGHRGKVVWLPTFDAENQIRVFGQNRPFVPVVKDGKPVPELAEVFKVIAENDLVLATGHSSPEESIILLDAARRAGVKRLVVTHVFTQRVRSTLEQMKQMAALGAVMELIWYVHMPNPAPGVGGPAPTAPIPIADAVKAVQTIGADHFLISSDLGQAGAPVHTAGMRSFVTELKKGGLSDAEIKKILCTNPSRLLGLAP
jgi:predicted TIM-barrel fold metal-dependent hydrolase